MKLAPLLFLGLAACGTDTFVTPDAGDAGGSDVVVPDGGPTCNGGLTLCGSTCTDTKTDVAHCGDCNTACVALDAGAAACMGGTCVYPMTDSACVALNGDDVFWTNGRGPETGGVYRIGHGTDAGAPALVAGGQPFPHGVAADDNQVYWADIGASSNDGTVHRASPDGSNVKLVADSSSGVLTPGPIVVANNQVFWANVTDSSIWAAPTTGGKSIGPLDFATGVPLFFTSTSTAIYWTANPISLSGSPTIGKYKFGDASGADVYTGQSGQIFGGLSTDDSGVCLARTAEQVVACGIFQVQGPNLPVAKGTPAYGLAKTADGSALYWTEHVPGGNVMKHDTGANTTTSLAQDDSPTCIAIDGQYVYWTARGRLTPGVVAR